MVALGTSLPELVTGVSSARRRVSDLGIGNVLGANVANLSLVPGAAASIAPVGIDRAEQLFNMTALLTVMAVVALLIVRQGRISRRAGIGCWCSTPSTSRGSRCCRRPPGRSRGESAGRYPG
jgi:cation:H+ antiporter